MDQVPTPREALELRELAPSLWAHQKIGSVGRKVKANRVVGDVRREKDGGPAEKLAAPLEGKEKGEGD
jgi:hypothetical protein